MFTGMECKRYRYIVVVARLTWAIMSTEVCENGAAMFVFHEEGVLDSRHRRVKEFFFDGFHFSQRFFVVGTESTLLKINVRANHGTYPSCLVEYGAR